ncbi:TIGR04255 family protein [Gimesia maris]|nr:TIGR04255 family protein [Gimesia maris]EDL61756.1 hypothetical protein PM8797T_05625 [Gimesia maris DSM 8797]
MSNENCPSFDNPPVIETALSIQFDELSNFKTTHFGMFYETVKDRFPIVVDKSRLAPVKEYFPRIPQMQGIRFRSNEGGPERVWYKEPDNGSKMLQLQPDRYVFNWCRKDLEEYPRYETYLPVCLEEFKSFSDWAVKNDLGEIKPNLCEVTYINRLYTKEGENLSDFFGTVFTGLEWKTSDGWLRQPPENASFNRVFVIGNMQGRLFVEAGFAVDSDGQDFILLKITARVNINQTDELKESMDLAHLWVVKGFASLTSEHVQKERWKRSEP